MAGSPVLRVDAGVAVRDAAPSSRRLTAATVHASGATAGVSPVLRDPSEDSGVALTVLIVAADDAARVPERAALRLGAVVSLALVWADSEALALAEPDEPEEPVVSANASGIAATAEPTPNATANAPTRPTTTKPDINNSLVITGYPGHYGQRYGFKHPSPATGIRKTT